MRRLGLSVAILMTGGLLAAAGAQAEPPPPCSYELSPPQLSTVGGADMVAVSVSPAACGFPAAPGFGVACVQRLGSDVQCSQGRGQDAAQILTPYRPGATYVASGRGCGSWAGISATTPNCQLLGPISATL